MNRLTLKVAARYQRAHEFPTPEALKTYLHDHPQADPKNHSVRKQEAPKKSWKDLVTGLSSKAREFVRKAPEAVKKFVQDEGFRRQTLQAAHKIVEAAPRAFIQGVLKEAKAEAHEIKTAGEGLLGALKGQKMSHEQQHALKAVATHVAIAGIATALTGGFGGLALGTAKAFSSSLAKKVALKAVTHKLAAIPTLHELAHGAHGATHLLQNFVHLASDEEPTPEEAFELFVASCVMSGLKDLDPDTVAEALEESSEVSV